MDPVSCLKEQLERNKRLRNDVEDLNSNIESLRGYSKKLKLETSPLSEQQMKITSKFTSLASANDMFSGRSQLSIDKLDRDLTHDDVYFPVFHGSLSNQVSCPGCGQQFKRYGTTFERAYYIHCIKECNGYQNLGKIRRCSGCSKYLIDHRSLMNHKCHLPLRPSWMPPSVFREGVRGSHFKDARCPGCDVVIKNARHIYCCSFEYLYHVIEECTDYQKLDRIKECIDCGYKFMNAKAYSRHCMRAHGNHASYHCHVCSAEFDSTRKLRSHSKAHPDDRPFKCTSCENAFKTNGSLSRHLKKVCFKATK